MINLYFGLPGTGKTTLIAKMIDDNNKNKHYKNVYCNVHMLIDGYTYISNDEIGKYDISDGLLLIDEGSIFADNRDYKAFSKELTAFFMLHRHYNLDICIFSQSYNAVDKKIRTLCNNLYYMYKPTLTGWYRTAYYKIPYGIIIPDARKNKQLTGNALGDINEGYCKPPFLQRVFSKKFTRRKYYKYFDSWEAPPLPPLKRGENRV